MAKVLLKRGNGVNLPGTLLEAGEPAFSLDTGKLYIGNGRDKILINPDGVPASEASKLSTARQIELTGDAVGASLFDGSKDIQIILALADRSITEGQYTKLRVNSKGIVTEVGNLTAEDIPKITLAKVLDAGTAAAKNVGTAKGNVPVLDANGKLDGSIIPANAITDVFVVSSESEMLGLSAQGGDVAVRTDINRSYILRVLPASVVGNWQELLVATGAVTSVNGRVGVVTLDAASVGAVPTERKVNGKPLSSDIILAKTDVGLGNVANESKAVMFTNPTFTGIARAATPVLTDNSTAIATTAFVQGQGYIDSGSTIDGGVF